jgi:hypothetical protein
MQVQLTAAEAREQVTETGVPILEDLAREGARHMLTAALELEVAEYVGRHAEERDPTGHRLVVHDGKAKERKVLITGLPVPVQAPRVDERREGEKFPSAVLPPYRCRSQRLEDVLPILFCGVCPRGISRRPSKSC